MYSYLQLINIRTKQNDEGGETHRVTLKPVWKHDSCYRTHLLCCSFHTRSSSTIDRKLLSYCNTLS